MSDVDSSAYAQRLAAATAAGGKKSFQDLASTGTGTLPMPGTAQGNEILAWLSGNRMRILDSNDDLRPKPRSDRSDDQFGEAKPQDRIDAALRRASVLTDLRKESPRDPRVMAVFESDPIVAEDPSTLIIVTSKVLRARADVFDALLTMLGKPILTRSVRSWLAVRLSNAFTALSKEAQKEWAISEVRLEETRVFLEKRSQQELDPLGEQLGQLIDARDIWAAMRAFSIAAHMGSGRERTSAQIADLLELHDFDED